MMLTLLFGIYRGMDADATMWDVAKLLFSLTVNPGLDDFDSLESKNGESISGLVSSPLPDAG